MDPSTVAQRISELPLMKELPADARKQVAEVFLEVADVLRYEDGEPLITEGYLSFLTGYVLVDGKANVEPPDRDPIEVSAPAMFGEMAQFRTSDMRSATVRAKGSAIAAQFYWEDLYRVAEEKLSKEAHRAFRDAVERQIWERFEFKEIVNLPLWSDLPEEIRLKVCMPFPSIAECVRLQEIDTLFNQGTVCKGTGYLLVRGKLKLFRKGEGEKIIDTPNIAGIFPNKSDKITEWTATAMASGQAELLKFSWDKYIAVILKVLSRDEQVAFVASVKKNVSKHFRH